MAADHKDELLSGVDPAWVALMDHALLSAALKGLGDAEVAPPRNLIFEALRYGTPADVVGVIIGQDPYPKAGDAVGLCFSVGEGVAVPQSLRRVFGCLERSGLRPARGGPRDGDLRPWAAQGILMLNKFLTTQVGSRRAHAHLWRPFVTDLVRKFCADRESDGAQVHFMLWGGDARKFAPMAELHGHVALEWSHPSPMSDNKLEPSARFRECDHFEVLNASLREDGARPIVWDNLATAVAFSDGSCRGNGTPKARAGFAAAVIGAQFGNTVVRGEVSPTTYEYDGKELRAGAAAVAPSNNRGELLGIIHCELALLAGKAIGDVEIVSDSKICVNTLLTWLPNRLAKGTENEMKNFDLVMIAWRLLGELRALAKSVTLTHMRSHQPKPPPDAPSRARLLWAGNELADRHAGEACAADEADYGVNVIGSCAPVRRLATS